MRLLPCAELSMCTQSLHKAAPRLEPLPLHAGLPTEAQLQVFQPAEKMTRKVVVSTNIAEVSWISEEGDLSNGC